MKTSVKKNIFWQYFPQVLPLPAIPVATSVLFLSVYSAIVSTLCTERLLFFLIQATASLIFSVISSLLGLAIIGYYAYTGAVFWNVYLSHRHYVVIVCFTCLFAIAGTITGACAAIYIYEPEQVRN